MFCTEHGKLIGFQALKFSESERTVFELIRTRFPVAPPLVVYDNACNVARFCLIRDLAFFLRVRFILDKLHESNHRKCSPSFSPQINSSVIRKINTSKCEQENALYADKKSQFYFFAQDMYLFHLRLIVCLRHLSLDAAVVTTKKRRDIKDGKAVAQRQRDVEQYRRAFSLYDADSSGMEESDNDDATDNDEAELDEHHPYYSSKDEGYDTPSCYDDDHEDQM